MRKRATHIFYLLAVGSCILFLSINGFETSSDEALNEQLLEIVSDPDDRPSIDSLILVCESASKMAEKRIRNEDSFSLQSAFLAKVIIERLRNGNNFIGNVREDFVEQFYSLCVPLAAELLPEHISYESNSEGVIDKFKKYAKSLLVQSFVSNSRNRSRTYSYILSVQWIYHNYLDEHDLAQKAVRLSIENHSNNSHFVNLQQKYSYLGTSLLNLGELEEALYYMRKSLSVILKNSDKKKHVEAYFSVAYAYLKLGNYESARRYFNLVLDLEENKSVFAQIFWDECKALSLLGSKALVQLGKIDRLSGRSDSALISHNCALKLLKGESDYYYFVALVEKSKDLVKLAKFDKAKETIRELLSSEQLLISHKLQSLILLLSIEMDTEPSSFSAELKNQIERLLEENINSYPIEYIEFSKLKMNYAAKIQDKELFESSAKLGFDMIREYKRQIKDFDSWSSAQYSFVEDYISAIYSSNNLSEIERTEYIVEALEVNYSLKLHSDGNEYYFNPAADIVPSKLKSLWQNRLDAEQALIKGAPNNRLALQLALDEAKDEFMAYQLNAPINNVEESPELSEWKGLGYIQRQLKDDEILIRYFVSERQSLSIVITKTGVSLSQLPKALKIRGLVDSLNDYVASNIIETYMMNNSFSQLLPLELLADKQYTKLIVIPDDVLHRIPFTAININNKKHSYIPLGDLVQVVRSYSFGEYLNPEIVRNQKNRDAIDRVAVFADPDFNKKHLSESFNQIEKVSPFRDWTSNLARLPFTAEEANSIKQIFSEKSVKVLLGANVTNRTMMGVVANKSKVLHIATHGYYDPSTPDVVGIATSPEKLSGELTGGFLSLTQLLSQPFHNDLVVISGCETMLGEYYEGAGMKSLTRGLLSKGAGSVIGTLWKVGDRSTAEFMKLFYEALKREKNSSMALHIAKSKLALHPDFQDPFYWAGFVLTSANVSYETIVILPTTGS